MATPHTLDVCSIETPSFIFVSRATPGSSIDSKNHHQDDPANQYASKHRELAMNVKCFTQYESRQKKHSTRGQERYLKYKLTLLHAIAIYCASR